MSFAAAVSSAQNFAAGMAMMNYAKAQSLRGAVQTLGNRPIATALASNRLYRIWLYVGKKSGAIGAPNHEIIAITGANNNDIVYFEPNFGFFQPARAGMTNREALEYWVNPQYDAGGNKVGAFAYYNVRAVTAATPLSFS